MPRPGTTLLRGENPTPRSARTDTGPGFMVGLTGKGSDADARTPSRNLDDWIERFGERDDAPFLYDQAEFFFRAGGSELFTAREVGPAAVRATADIDDASGNATLVATAKSAGAWANGAAGGLAFDVDVTGTDFVLKFYLNGVLVEQSPLLADRPAAVAWAQANSDYVDLALGVDTDDPAATASNVNLAGGTDDRASVTDATFQAALDLFTRDLGPGQLFAPGTTTVTRVVAAMNHATASNRRFLPDSVDSGVKATLLAQNDALTGLTENAERDSSQFLWPWLVVPGLTSGTTRTIPPSGVIAGLLSRHDGLGRSPNQPAAGDLGQLEFVLDLSQTAFSDDDREDLNEGGVNVIREMYGGFRLYGFRTLADPLEDDNWVNLGNSRMFMAIHAEGDAIAERFVFRELDARRITANEYGGELIGMLLPYWEAGSLYGVTPEEAFNVDVGESVNTDASMADGFLKAKITLRMSQFAEEVVLELVKARTTEAVA